MLKFRRKLRYLNSSKYFLFRQQAPGAVAVHPERSSGR
jgi:hypothetical protein